MRPAGARGVPATPAGVRIVVSLLSGGSLRSPPAKLLSPRWGGIRKGLKYLHLDVFHLIGKSGGTLADPNADSLRGKRLQDLLRNPVGKCLDQVVLPAMGGFQDDRKHPAVINSPVQRVRCGRGFEVTPNRQVCLAGLRQTPLARCHSDSGVQPDSEKRDPVLLRV